MVNCRLLSEDGGEARLPVGAGAGQETRGHHQVIAAGQYVGDNSWTTVGQQLDTSWRQQLDNMLETHQMIPT